MAQGGEQKEETLDLTESGGAGFSKSDVKNFDMEKEKIHLARWVLAGLLILFILSFVAYVAKLTFIDEAATKEVFDFVKVSFPPIVTLILGAYFKSKD